MSTTLILLLAAAVGGIIAGYALRILISLSKKGSIELQIKQLLLDAKEESKRIVHEAEQSAQKRLDDAKNEIKEKEDKLKDTEIRLNKKEDTLEKQSTEVQKEIETTKQKIAEVRSIKERVDGMLVERSKKLEEVAKLTTEQAKQALFKEIESKATEDIESRIHKLKRDGEDRYEQAAQNILTMSIQRLATSVAHDAMSTVISIPSEDVKGKIIGKEGRNIKAFERATGVEVLVDESPDAIVISSFDPIRRQVAKAALEELMKDGRIQPSRIEQVVEKAQQNLNKIAKEKGDQAAYECGVFNLDPKLLLVLGRLHFRTSYGQNVLQHSIEVSHLAGMIAAELGVNVYTAKAAGLLHDLGKALDHEVAGTHVEIGRKLLQKFNVAEDIIKGMQAHHEEYPYETLESRIVQTADAISGSRPGARRDSLDVFLKRLEDLEKIVKSFGGIEKTYALQAGREIRVFVKPEEVTDKQAHDLARNIAISIEKDLRYPGEIKIMIIRETRVTEFAR